MAIIKKSPLSILSRRRVVNLASLKQPFYGFLFQVSFYLLYNLFIIYSLFYQVYTYSILHLLLEAS